MKVLENISGAKTLFSEQYREHYHSVIEGAYIESMKKHIEPAFASVIDENTQEVVVLDICFGLGYNTLCFIKKYFESNMNFRLKIVSPELNVELIKSLPTFDYSEELVNYKHIIKAVSDNFVYEAENISVEVLVGCARNILDTLEPCSVDIVFQDPFSPKNNIELWTVEYFAQISRLLKPRAVITTYSKSTGARLAMMENGLNLYEHIDKSIRGGTIAANFKLDMFRLVDMEKKLKNAPFSRAFKDLQ